MGQPHFSECHLQSTSPSLTRLPLPTPVVWSRSQARLENQRIQCFTEVFDIQVILVNA